MNNEKGMVVENDVFKIEFKENVKAVLISVVIDSDEDSFSSSTCVRGYTEDCLKAFTRMQAEVVECLLKSGAPQKVLPIIFYQTLEQAMSFLEEDRKQDIQLQMEN